MLQDYLALGTEQYTNDEYDEAIDSLSKAIKLEPEDSDAYFLRGISYLMKENPDNALADSDKALELDPSGTDVETIDAEIYWMRGAGHRFKRYYDKAIVDSEKAIELDPTHADAGKALEDANNSR